VKSLKPKGKPERPIQSRRAKKSETPKNLRKKEGGKKDRASIQRTWGGMKVLGVRVGSDRKKKSQKKNPGGEKKKKKEKVTRVKKARKMRKSRTEREGEERRGELSTTYIRLGSSTESKT